MKFKVALSAAVAAIALSAVSAPVMAQEQEDEAARTLDTVVTVGTRVANRSALDTAAPVDVVSSEAIQNIGVGELNQSLSVNLPALNFPRPALTDGTDSVRPAALRGLSPDQTLVLVNGKRRHTASLVNVNGSIGRGASAVDLNTIPNLAVGGVEVLRDGASALYGSDAIAGVVNVRLREANTGGAVSVSYGWRETEYTTPVVAPTAAGVPDPGREVTRERSDGHVATVAGWKGFSLGQDGFLTLTGEYKDQNHTERSGYDFRQQYPGSQPAAEAEIGRFNAWTGEPDLEQISLFANAGYGLANGAELYGWASFQDRETVSAGFFRRALDDRNTIEIYPNGFLPKINPTTTDYSALGGIRFDFAGWDADASLGYGSNKMEFQIIDTLNRSLGTASGTEFDAGGFEHSQLVANIGFVKGFAVDGLASDLNVAWGAEARQENYEIFAGEPDSYRNGGVLLPGGGSTASGAQVFPGFQPANELEEDRTAVGVYLDVEANVTDALLLSGAVRGESYSDFGEALTGKLAARYDFNDAFALRGSIQNGFRAPSLQQQYYTTTSTNFINGVPFDVTTFRVDDPIARALGAQDLDAEKSINYAIGAVFQAGAFNMTVDAYRIDVEDRIVLSENLTAGNVQDFLVSQGFIGSGGGRFFINGVETETTGVDIIANYAFPETEFGSFTATAGANFNKTEVTGVPAIPVLTGLTPPPVLFARTNILTLEEGTPKDKFTGQVNWEHGPFAGTLRAVRYGEVLVPSNTPALDYTLDPQTLIDLEARYTWNDMLTLAVGADNILDEYPDAAPLGLNSTGNTPFSSYSPFGYSGRFVYTKATLNF
ncbi:TonB-dependent receptor [Hyphomonas neptunium ATCC 15444]|uniref:TonB-dependent receptor n=2 Tax=Hyphomonas TaxID=85 RepID=Q0BWT9_HYPNA|nr:MULTISPECIES: TonB-dependent receptor [Hyphomonas]ABI77059.1 TonB-dependent receptor [Hyphomonas neptunium ATCC 15444]KCZ91947.1 TonB-dependent receptor [Hyphomonas hirschiana VP5]